MRIVKDLVIGTQIIVLGMLLGAGLYESLVNAPNFAANIPASLEHARMFWSEANPGNFFRIFAPMAQLLALASLIVNWRTPPGRRWWLVGALLAIVVADVVTFTFHYPRNALLLGDPLGTDTAVLRQAAIEWGLGNWARIAVTAIAVVSSIVAFSRNRTA